VAHALAAGASRVIPVADVEAARALHASHRDWLLVGERHARRLPGFDCGNSPTEVLAQGNLAGRTIVHTTHAGTQGLVAAAGSAAAVLTGALVNAAATVRRVRELGTREVTIVAMGHEARQRCVEDDLCRDLLLARLQGRPFDASTIGPTLRAAPAAEKFFDPAADWAPEGDFALCSAVDVIDFAVQLRRQPEGFAALERVG
jgi:2-phosphosulfolactate phosphatase